MGKLLSELLPYDNGRQVSVYLPSRPVEVILYCGDGQLLAPWGFDLEQDDLPSTMIVGAHRHTDETIRLGEYSPKLDPPRFQAHEDFLINDVRSWVKARLDINLARERTVAYGVSAGGELALALGGRHPNIFGSVLSASPGAGYRPTEEVIDAIPPTYLVAGIQEPFFLENALRWADALQGNGKEVVFEKRVAGHDDAMWRLELPKMISWVFS